MNKLAIATNNKKKLIEINELFEHNEINNIQLYSISDLDIVSDPDEDGSTLEENALIKAKSLFKKTNIPTIADDTGLFVEALDGKPGVKSARYASDSANDEQNRELLLSELSNSTNRYAHFKTTICYLDGDGHHFFNGICEGAIAVVEKGNNGFGYDPIFIPNNYDVTFAEMNPEIKNSISHRHNALAGFINWYKESDLIT